MKSDYSGVVTVAELCARLSHPAVMPWLIVFFLM